MFCFFFCYICLMLTYPTKYIGCVFWYMAVNVILIIIVLNVLCIVLVWLISERLACAPLCAVYAAYILRYLLFCAQNVLSNPAAWRFLIRVAALLNSHGPAPMMEILLSLDTLWNTNSADVCIRNVSYGNFPSILCQLDHSKDRYLRIKTTLNSVIFGLYVFK